MQRDPPLRPGFVEREVTMLKLKGGEHVALAPDLVGRRPTAVGPRSQSATPAT